MTPDKLSSTSNVWKNELKAIIHLNNISEQIWQAVDDNDIETVRRLYNENKKGLQETLLPNELEYLQRCAQDVDLVKKTKETINDVVDDWLVNSTITFEEIAKQQIVRFGDLAGLNTPHKENLKKIKIAPNRYRVLDLDDRELGQFPNMELAVKCFKERRPQFDESQIKHFIYEITK